METIEPQKVTKREGDTLTLVCPVKNELNDNEEENMNEEDEISLKIQWSKDGRPMEQQNAHEVFGVINYEVKNLSFI